MTNIDEANISEAAKAFYREHMMGNYNRYGGWSEADYRLIRELNLAGLITVGLLTLKIPVFRRILRWFRHNRPRLPRVRTHARTRTHPRNQ